MIYPVNQPDVNQGRLFVPTLSATLISTCTYGHTTQCRSMSARPYHTPSVWQRRTGRIYGKYTNHYVTRLRGGGGSLDSYHHLVEFSHARPRAKRGSTVRCPQPCRLSQPESCRRSRSQVGLGIPVVVANPVVAVDSDVPPPTNRPPPPIQVHPSQSRCIHPLPDPTTPSCFMRLTIGWFRAMPSRLRSPRHLT